MATPSWIQDTEKVVAENHISLDDVANRPAKTIHANFLVAHNADGTPKEVHGAIGEIRPYIAVETPPTGWLECDGAAISRTTYADLYSGKTLSIGVKFGNGDGSTTFNLPDLRGRFLRGWDHGAGVDPDAATRTNRGDGVTGDHVGTKQVDNFKSHVHNVVLSSGSASSPAASINQSVYGSFETSAAGGNETRPININVMYCIKY